MYKIRLILVNPIDSHRSFQNRRCQSIYFDFLTQLIIFRFSIFRFNHLITRHHTRWQIQSWVPRRSWIFGPGFHVFRPVSCPVPDHLCFRSRRSFDAFSSDIVGFQLLHIKFGSIIRIRIRYTPQTELGLSRAASSNPNDKTVRSNQLRNPLTSPPSLPLPDLRLRSPFRLRLRTLISLDPKNPKCPLPARSPPAIPRIPPPDSEVLLSILPTVGASSPSFPRRALTVSLAIAVALIPPFVRPPGSSFFPDYPSPIIFRFFSFVSCTWRRGTALLFSLRLRGRLTPVLLQGPSHFYWIVALLVCWTTWCSSFCLQRSFPALLWFPDANNFVLKY